MTINSPQRVRKSLPNYRLHKRTGQGVVTLNGRDFYLGPHGTKASLAEYDRLIKEWLANDRKLAAPISNPSHSVNELILGYWRYVQSYYIKDGQPTSEQSNIRSALRSLRKLYGHTFAEEFSPLALKTVREEFVSQGLSRSTVNRYVGLIVRMFKWAVENELVPVTVWQSLNTVSGLRKGRCEAPETDAVRPVPDEKIRAVEPYLSPQIWAMIQLQLLTGMRPGEVAQMRTGDVDQTGESWIYVPRTHKNAHRGHVRRVILRPKAQALLKPWLRDDPDLHLFSPKEVVEQTLQLRSCRDTPSPKRPGRKKPRRPPGDYYTAASYRKAIHRACEQAFDMPDELKDISRAVRALQGAEKEAQRAHLQQEARAWRNEHCWAPNQLRHNAATRIRENFGIEAARITLGHRSAVTTEIYAEADLKQTHRIMRELG